MEHAQDDGAPHEHGDGSQCEDCDQGERGGHGGEHPVHEPAPPEKRRLVADAGMFVRGLGLTVLAAAAFVGMTASVQKLGWLATPLAALLGVAGVLATWAAAIHVTGGEKFDDHPWV
jgi:hypothetical protein